MLKQHANGVIELEPRDQKATVCGTCGRGWDDSHVSGLTPTPAGRCPFEYEHGETPSAWDKADTECRHKGTGQPMAAKKAGPNTYWHRLPNGDIAMHYHTTDVMVTHTDGSYTLDSGGWRTYTTKERINWGLPGARSGYRDTLHQEDGVWYLTRLGPDGWHDVMDQAEFADGMRVYPPEPGAPMRIEWAD